MIYILLGYYIATYFLLIFSSYKESYSKYRIFAKTATSLGFIAIAVYSGFASGNMSFFYSSLPAFLFCFGGDVLLEVMDEKGSKKYFIAGLLSFLIGHIMFVVAFLKLQPFTFYEMIIPAASVILTLLLHLDKNLDTGKMKPYVLIYSFFVSWLFSKGLFVFLAQNNTATALILSGSALFFISDILILFLLFYKKKASVTRFLNLLTYYAAQLLLAISVYFVLV